MFAEARTLFAGLPPAVRAAAVFYLLHLFFQPKIAASQIALSIALLAFFYALARRQVTLAWSPLYPALLIYVAGCFASALAPRSNSMELPFWNVSFCRYA